MTPLKAVFLTFVMLSAIAFWGFGIYAADASAHVVVTDGYGVSAVQ